MQDNPDVRLAHIEYLLEKALRRKGLEVGTGGAGVGPQRSKWLKHVEPGRAWMMTYKRFV